ncbi:MAG: GGDEF domain-containing protein [Magnetococcales bacterium]|nr:GGDEF domain-containing protein [Magnetococcales bacterium]
MNQNPLAIHLRTGVAEIDTMHQKIVNALESVRVQCIRLAPSPLIQSLLDELQSLAMSHFLLEEQWMAEVVYPDMAAHVEEHRQFQQEFSGLTQALFREQDGSRRGTLVGLFIKEWLERHTSDYDVPLGQFIRARQKQQLIGGQKWLHAFLVHHFTQIMGGLTTDLWSLFWPWKQPFAMAGHRARIIISRVRLLAGLFALLTPVWILVDFFFFPVSLAWHIALGRIAVTIAFTVLAISFKKTEQMSKAYLAAALLFLIPTGFFLFTSRLFLDNPPAMSGFAADLTTGYAFLPFVMAAGISIFPLTALEGFFLSIPGIMAEMITGHFNLTFQSQPGNFGILWLMAIIAGVAILAAMSQLHFWSEIIAKTSRDALTLACNRAAGHDLMERYFLLAKRNNTSMMLLFIDVDNFKSINDQYGHDAGDKALCTIAASLQRLTRKIDVIVRWGGEEFIVVLPLTENGNTMELIRRICHPQALGSRPDGSPLTASVGVAELLTDRSETLSSMIALADSRMYRAKKTGKNRVCFSDAVDGMTQIGTFG